ncbi:helix-turn-helix domain-containing protein [Virgibacillus halodenitrificans]|uniref:helix-turn-helix domain-containing protein n=1 Tax=Virgibacillus halodenitrificans TaxID=1482 RepID=UPI0003145873|nr:helix-turn-helix domain-containing protein [Virgibacillus halodenitrificans]MYL44626.1 helix-turn-helix domain-containing protein [Virgibacillus halodenitrificans]MYL56162.1 helix-turn-helix domain-containing protein [Virgibacillus halodenitrificans]
MSMEEAIRQIIQEENKKHLVDIKRLLESHGYHEAPRFLKVPEAAEILRIGRTATYELCQQTEHNGFPCIKEGNKIRIPYTALMNWIEEQTKQVIS